MTTNQSNMLVIGLAIVFLFMGIFAFIQSIKPDFIYYDDPIWLKQLHKLDGLKETEGPENTKWIEDSFILCGLPEELRNDNKTSWCSSGMCKVFEDLGIKSPKDARAESWIDYGAGLWTTRRGAICVFQDNGLYHVTVLANEKPVPINGVAHYECMGCNQSDTIKISRYKVSSLVVMRWPTISERYGG